MGLEIILLVVHSNYGFICRCHRLGTIHKGDGQTTGIYGGNMRMYFVQSHKNYQEEYESDIYIENQHSDKWLFHIKTLMKLQVIHFTKHWQMQHTDYKCDKMNSLCSIETVWIHVQWEASTKESIWHKTHQITKICKSDLNTGAAFESQCEMRFILETTHQNAIKISDTCEA